MTEPEGDREPEPRRPRSVYGIGGEPDPRFSMANERTALAWVAVAVAVVARQARRADSPWERLLALAAVPVLLAVVAVLLAAVG